jgi:hypothetical protein
LLRYCQAATTSNTIIAANPFCIINSFVRQPLKDKTAATRISFGGFLGAGLDGYA